MAGENAALIADLNRAKVLFQQRALLAALDIPVSHAPSCEGAGSLPGNPRGSAPASPVNQVPNHFHNLE